MKKSELESVIDAFVEVVDSWNDAAADEDRGRSNDKLCLTLYDDGSGFLGKRRDYDGPDGNRVTQCEDYHEFGNLDELVKVLTKGEGVEVEEDANAPVKWVIRKVCGAGPGQAYDYRQSSGEFCDDPTHAHKYDDLESAQKQIPALLTSDRIHQRGAIKYDIIGVCEPKWEATGDLYYSETLGKKS